MNCATKSQPARIIIRPTPGSTRRCQVLERRHKVIELTLTVPTEEAANAICTNWAKKSQDVYAHLMDELLK